MCDEETHDEVVELPLLGWAERTEKGSLRLLQPFQTVAQRLRALPGQQHLMFTPVGQVVFPASQPVPLQRVDHGDHRRTVEAGEPGQLLLGVLPVVDEGEHPEVPPLEAERLEGLLDHGLDGHAQPVQDVAGRRRDLVDGTWLAHAAHAKGFPRSSPSHTLIVSTTDDLDGGHVTTRLEPAIRVMLVVVGAVTATPALALVVPATLEASYGLADPDPMTTALLQHRGLLQAMLGAAIIWAAFAPALRLPLVLVPVITKTTFLALTLGNPAVRGDVTLFSTVFDVVAVMLLLAVAVPLLRGKRAVPLAAER
jgi:hypothetical protein